MLQDFSDTDGGGYVVTRGGQLVSAGVRLEDVETDFPDSTLYLVSAANHWTVNDGSFDCLARIVIPRGRFELFGVDLDVEIDEVSL